MLLHNATRKIKQQHSRCVCVGVCTRAVSSVVEVDSKSARLVLSLPRHRRAVLVVGVGVVVVNIPGKRTIPKTSQSCQVQTGDTRDLIWEQSYFPVSILERDGQHMGVVTKAFVNQVPPSSMIRRVLFIACIDPADRSLLFQSTREGRVPNR